MRKIVAMITSLALGSSLMLGPHLPVSYASTEGVTTVDTVQAGMDWQAFVKIKNDRFMIDGTKVKQHRLSHAEIKQLTQEVRKQNKLAREIEQVSAHMRWENGELIFDAEQAKRDGLSNELIEQTVSDLQKIEEPSEPSVSAPMGGFSIMAVASTKPKPSCNGENKVVSRWYGSDVYFDSCHTNKLVGLLAKGGGAVAVGSVATMMIPSLKPYAAITTLAGMIVSLGASTIDSANANGCGVYFRCATAASLPFWVHSQC